MAKSTSVANHSSRRRLLIVLLLLAFLLLFISYWPAPFSLKGAFLLGVGLLYSLFLSISRPIRLGHLFAPFPSCALLLFFGGVVSLVYPFSETLQDIGLLPLFLFGAFLDGLLSYVLMKKRLELGALTTGLVIAAFIFLSEMAGSPHLSILPPDLPQAVDQHFTPDGIAKALVTEITTWPLRTSPLIESAETGVTAPETPFSSSLQISQQSPLFPFHLEIPHIIGEAEAGSIHLAPVYHLLRHLRQRPTLEARMVIGHDGNLTLALHGLYLPSSCLDATGVDALLGRDIQGEGRAALEDLRAAMERLVADSDLRADTRNPNCAYTFGSTLLSRLGLAPTAKIQDSVIGQATYFGHRPNVGLQEVVERSIVAAMAKISPQRMGLYYDTRRRHYSALTYYKMAFPLAIQEAVTSGGREDTRQRVADLLTRIADLQTTPKTDKGRDWTQVVEAAF